jgi:hypothetical protein
MYHLLVFYEDDDEPRERLSLNRASKVLSQIPVLLSRHPGCERVVVTANFLRLFAVDRKGARLPD